MDTMYPAATYTATRDELLGEEPLLGAAEIARGVCRGAERTVSVLAVTSVRMRRIDGWIGPVGFVTHAASPDPSRAVLGSVCDRDRAEELVDEIVVSLVGALPETSAPGPVDLAPLDALSPGTIDAEIDWVVVVTATSTQRPEHPTRTIVASAGGLVIGDLGAVDRAARLVPAAVDEFRATLAAAVGPVPRSVRELLGND